MAVAVAVAARRACAAARGCARGCARKRRAQLARRLRPASAGLLGHARAPKMADSTGVRNC
jgi:hypothetical protein